MDAQELVDMFVDGKWVVLGAVLIGLVVRLLKDDTKIPITIPPVWRPFFALGLGFVGSVVNRIANGTPWKQSLEYGIAASILSICGHDIVIENLRKGKEVPLPGITKKEAANE